MFGISKNDNEFINYIHGKNVQNLRLFSLAVCAICALLYSIDSGPNLTLKYGHLINQASTAVVFFTIFLVIWFILNFAKLNIQLQKYVVWGGLISTYLFSSTVTYLTLAQDSGTTGLFAIAHLMIAVLFSTRFAHYLLLLFINGVIFTILTLQIETLNIVETMSGIVVIISLSILVSVSLEKQRREVFNSDKELKKKIEELNNALDVKATFFGHMSHELRTPLNAIIGFSDMLRNNDLRPQQVDKVREYAQYIYTGGNHLLALVNDLLDQNKIETGEITVTVEPLNVIHLLNDYINELKPLSNDKNQKIEFIELKKNIEIQSDRRLFKQVIYNILSNAIKYSPRNSIINIYMNISDPDTIEIIVKDYGKGMPEQVIDQIANPETTVETHFISNSEGTGLGLIIVRQLMTRLKGNIVINSEENVSTEIKLTFPVQFS